MKKIKSLIIIIKSQIISSIYYFYLRVRFPNIKLKDRLHLYGGMPYIYSSLNSKIEFGTNCTIINSTKYNRIGIIKKTSICAERNGNIILGNNVGLSGVSICSHDQIIIGNNVLVGANTFIFDTDFHSIESEIRLKEIKMMVPIGEKTKPICIENNVFIGANTIINKGVRIGANSIIAAGSVVTRNIPTNEIWGGNPASFIKGTR